MPILGVVRGANESAQLRWWELFGYQPRHLSAAVLMAAIASCFLLGACGSSGSGSDSMSVTLTPRATVGGCRFPGFDLPNDNPNPHADTPRQALDAFLAHGSVFGAVPPSRSPADVGYPTTAWQQTVATTTSTTFQSNGSEIDVTKVHNEWVVTHGHKAC
jgi:hypothetical protein